MDPNTIPLSPSDSALHRLSRYEHPPSLPPTESETSNSSTPRPPSVSLPPLESIPDIPDLSSRSARPTTAPKKVSKLAQLASARAHSKASVSGTEKSGPSGSDIDEGSVRTWSALRPVSASVPPASSVTSTRSSTSSYVRRAIQSAMELEALDAPRPPRVPSKDTIYKQAMSNPNPVQGTADTVPTPSSTPSAVSKSLHVPRPAAPTPTKASEQPQPPKAPSKLALLAQAKKASQTKAASPTKAFVQAQETMNTLAKTVDPDIGQVPKAGRQYTKILEPVANGDSVTTAITYSYESLRTLTDPSRRPQEALRLVGVDEASEKKPSKLAAKAKKSQQKDKPLPLTEENIALATTPPAIFLPSTAARNRASPSAFATILVDDLTHSQPKDKHKHRHGRHKSKEVNDAVDEETQTSKKVHKHRVPDLAAKTGFKFDEPSPDDVVIRAREGTSLRSRHAPPSPTQSRTKAVSSRA